MAGEMWGLEKTPLGRAIVEGVPYTVRRLIEKGENVRHSDRKGNTYLHYICTMNKPYVFNVLCAFGVPLNAQNIHGNTALHVSAIHGECCHVPDLLQCGAHPYIRNKDGKTAHDLAKHNPRWCDLYTKYEPSLMLAIQKHDIDAIKRLFGCWSAVHLPIDIQNGFNMRNYAAALTHHDIVSMIDKVRFSLMAVYAIKECDHKALEYALSRGPRICDVNYLHQVRGHPPHHMLQHAIRLNDVDMVTKLLKAGVDLNTRVLVNEYIMGPLYFEVLRSDRQIDVEIIRRVLSSDVDVTARDERGRSALVYCVDRRDRLTDIITDVIQILLDRGINVALRDNHRLQRQMLKSIEDNSAFLVIVQTGCTARDVALFARRHDIIACIDKCLVEMVRASDLSALRTLTVHGYTDLFMEHMARDTWIYAAGNDSDDATRFLQGVSQYWETAKEFIQHIRDGNATAVDKDLRCHDNKDLLMRYRDKSGRGPLLTSLLHGHSHIARTLLTEAPDIVLREQDNSQRNVLHYIEALGEQEQYKPVLLNFMTLEHLQTQGDVVGILPEEMKKRCPNFISKEQLKTYDMEKVVHCLQKYDELADIIRSKFKGLKHFNKVLKNLRYPVSDFHSIFCPGGHPLVPHCEDLVLLAGRQGREDLAGRLVQLGAGCPHTARVSDDDHATVINAMERAEA